MSGHSKWSTIKHKKEKTDATRGKIFTKIGREISVAVRAGGADPEHNARLRDVIAKAKANNMPNDNIQRSIKKASGEEAGAGYEEIVYEGYGKGGVAVFVEALTDNRNRTASDVRHAFDKFGNALGATGCVSYLFLRQGVIIVERTTGMDPDDVMMKALEAGAEDFGVEEDSFEITTAPQDYSLVREALERDGYAFLNVEMDWIPQTMVDLGTEDADALDVLIENLENLDDVQNVYHNANMEEDG